MIVFFRIYPAGSLLVIDRVRVSYDVFFRIVAIAETVISAAFTADFTSDPRRQTDRRTRGRTSEDVPDQPVPSRICRTCTAEHRPAWVCRIRRRTCPYSPRRSCTSSHPSVLRAFLCRIPGRTFRLPSRRTAGISRFLPPAWVPAFCCRSSGSNCR